MAKRKPLNRTLALKPILFSKEYGKQLTELIIEAHASCTNTGLRMQHDSYTDSATQQPEIIFSYFYNNLKHYENGAVYFELWSYVPGLMPAGFTPDLSAENATYDIAQIIDATGNPKEIVHISHVLVYKNVAIVEATKGTGGTYLIEKYLNRILRTYCKPRPPHVAFTTALSSDLAREIEQGGGAVSVSLGITSAMGDSDNPIAGLLSSAHSRFNSTGLVSLNWRAQKDTTLSVEEVVNEARTAEHDKFDQIFIKLRHGSIQGLKRFKITNPIWVKDAGGKNPDHSEIEKAMIDYLVHLMTPDTSGNRILDDEGNLVKNG